MQGRERRSSVYAFYLHCTCLTQGAVVVMTITWNCDLDQSGCDPVYDARRCALYMQCNSDMPQSCHVLCSLVIRGPVVCSLVLNMHYQLTILSKNCLCV